ncbi:MAG TPA: hypothetical protein VLJ37_11565 [bacterium]|nr:hypothetical protein [bacterium]
MTLGTQQLFQHVTLWSRVPQGLTAMDPWEASSLMAPAPAEQIKTLNGYMMEMRLQEIGLLKALNVVPDALRVHLENDRPFTDFFANLSPRPDWMSVHPNSAMTVDDLHQMRMAIVGAKRRLNAWSKRPTYSRPFGLVEHLHWLQESVRARSKLARLAVQLGEPDAGIRIFYDVQQRKAVGITTMEESLKGYFRVARR